MMGKMQGPRAVPSQHGTATFSAGFITITSNAYFNKILEAEVGDAVAFALVNPGVDSYETARVWLDIAEDAELAIIPPRANRYLSWWWTELTEETADAVGTRALALGVDTVVILNKWHDTGDEQHVSKKAFPSGINLTVEHLRTKYGVAVGLHTHPDIVWPCLGAGSYHKGSADLGCLSSVSGANFNKWAEQHLDAMVPEGLAPTFRSGSMYHTVETEDLFFAWCHDPLFPAGEWPTRNRYRHRGPAAPAVAHNGNPAPCGQGACNYNDWPSNDWAPDLSLFFTSWSNLGIYRGGYALGFDGLHSVGAVLLNEGEKWDDLDALSRELTIGLTLHPLPTAAAAGTHVLWERANVWRLALVNGAFLEWQVRTAGGAVLTARAANALSTTPGASHTVKATFNSTSGVALLFVNSTTVAASSPPQPNALLNKFNSGGGGSLAFTVGASCNGSLKVDPTSCTSHFLGAIEELYVKNVSTEARAAYTYSDDNRLHGTYLIDLTREAGQALFADALGAIFAQANFSVVQYDGFEKLQLISALDWAHSNRTANSSLFSGPANPDWYFQMRWPLRVGQGILKAMEAAAKMGPNVAIEASFQASGLGPSRADMAPYVDERVDRSALNATHKLNGLTLLGLQWHTKMLLRTELTGSVVNAYNTIIDASSSSSTRDIHSAFEIDYWLGGLIAGGIAPQLESSSTTIGEYDARIANWIARYRRFGHLSESDVQTLIYDTQCCHVQGECEWVACRDTAVVRLSGGTEQYSSSDFVGVVASSTKTAFLPSRFIHDNVTVLAFKAANVSTLALDLGHRTFQTLRVAMLAPRNASIATCAALHWRDPRCNHLVLSGDYFYLASSVQGINLTIRELDSGAVVRASTSLFPPGASGAQSFDSADWPVVKEETDAVFVYEFERVARSSRHLEYLGFYGCQPSTQAGWASLCISDNRSVFSEAKESGLAGMVQATWAFFENAKPPRVGLQLRADWQAGWREMWNGTECSTSGYPPCIAQLREELKIFGIFLGDELLNSGVYVTELTTAADAVKYDWPDAIVYWNEAWGPVVENVTWAKTHSNLTALRSVPNAIDWISLDYYRDDSTAWTVPEAAYPASVYPKMKPHQRALLVPQAFGRKNDVCEATCYANASIKGCCPHNHGSSGQHNHSRDWWDQHSTDTAHAYFQWAQRDAKIIGINPWYWGNDRSDPACGGYNISVRQLPKARAAWEAIGRQIKIGGRN